VLGRFALTGDACVRALVDIFLFDGTPKILVPVQTNHQVPHLLSTALVKIPVVAFFFGGLNPCEGGQVSRDDV